MKHCVIETNDLEETHRLGMSLGQHAAEGMVFLLKGDLGAGKTALTQGIAKGLGIRKNVTSPTFNIMKIYRGRLTLYHIDAYRLEGVHQDLGFEEYMNDDGLTVIEWSQFFPGELPEEELSVTISLLENDRRRFLLEARGKRYEDLLEVLQ